MSKFKFFSFSGSGAQFVRNVSYNFMSQQAYEYNY